VFQRLSSNMSLRRKIILLFGLLAIVPMLVLAGFSYWHAQSLLQESVQEQLQQTASDLARELAEAQARIDSSLGILATALEREPGGLADVAGHAAGGYLDSVLVPAAYLGVRSGTRPLRLLAGSVPEEPIRCEDGEGSRLVSFSRDLQGGTPEGALEVGFWVSDLLGQQGRTRAHSVAVVDPADGAVLLGAECYAEGIREGTVEGWALRGGMDTSAGQGHFRFKDEEGRRVGAFALVPDPGWTVVATTSLGEVLSSLQSLTLIYWLFVLALGSSTALAFSMLIGPFTRSLSELARAAEEIGLGELDPWLPLHSSGELGQLTTAFGGMLARIRQMMAQVDQSGRLAVVGQLSAYLAHEIRNPLSSIKLNLQRLRRWTRNGDLPEFCLEPLEISLREVERLNASVTGVLQLSRAEDSPREVVSLHHLVEEAADLMAPKFRRQGVGLSLDLDAEADRILARVGQVKSAVLNLMVNALEAQPTGGRLEIRTELSRAPELGGPVVALHFKDEGPGVPAEVRDRIFEPFFTTKPGGSGIGLAMASQSVRANGGDLLLEPSFMVAQGSDFVVVFPLAPLEATTGVSSPSPGAARPMAIPSPSRAGTGREDPLVALPLNPAVADEDRPEQAGVPTHLLTPEGLRAVLALSRPDSEEVH
jgi:signal transduction histidine kinase